MDWNEWYRHYDSLPSLQARLRIVREQIVATLDECPPGPIRIVSVCAGDGRDLVGALLNHPRRSDVTAWLLDNHAESIGRGQAAAEQAGLGRQLRFVQTDAAVAGNYAGIVPADLIILSGFLGHLRHEDVPGLIESLPMFCKEGGWAIWNRHLVLHKGHEQVPAIRELFRRSKFEEVHFATTGPDGFAVGRARFTGRVKPLDPARVLFEFVGLDRLLPVPLPAPAKLPVQKLKVAVAGGAEMNGTATVGSLGDVEQSIPARFEQVAVLHSSRIALGSGAWQPTYAELNAAANRFAHALISHGGAAGDRVALLLRHDTLLMAAVLAVLKAGRVVVVLDPTNPPTRLKEILDDAETGLIVTDATNHGLADRMAQPAHHVICFEEHSPGPTHKPEMKIVPQAVAFLLYTSGSTGRPKGVMQTHRNILHNVIRLTQGMALRPEDRIILLASLSGGLGLSTMWCALLNGAALCPFSTRDRGVVGLADWLVEQKTTVYVSSASVFRHFIRTLEGGEHFPAVRLVRLASEPAISNDFAAYQKHFADGCILFSTLSSSETGNLTQHRLTKSDRLVEKRLPVGWPGEGMEILLVDEHGQEVRDGETGEIIVRSRYLSPGYWRDEVLTAERFFGGDGPNDFRLFRSGDLGRRMADGALMFVDRKDTRVKVHGYRIEISEIEEVLARQPEVEGAVVCARATLNNDTQLTAYVVLRAGRTCDAERLRRRLRKILPGYMVPASFIFLDQFPLMPHGKVDRQALSPPSETRKRAHGARKPRDIVERNLTRIFESVLGVSAIGRRDDFFDLGGTSLQSVEVLAAIEEIFDVALPPSALVEHSTAERLAPLLSEHAVIPSARSLVVLRAGNGRRPLFLVHSGQGDVITYGLLVRKLRDRPIYGLQAVGLQGESWPLMGIPAMAERYLPEIIARDPAGPYLLAGTCMGGMVAFELAQRLVQMGRTVNLVALIDSPTPPYSGRRSRWHEAVLDPLRDAFRIFRWGIVRAGGFKANAGRLPGYRRFVAGMTGLANRRYRPAFYPGTITLMLTANTDFPAGDRRSLMAHHARETRTVTIPGSRPGLFVRPAVDELARQLQICLDLAESKS